jgi:hypothetical protein
LNDLWYTAIGDMIYRKFVLDFQWLWLGIFARRAILFFIQAEER